MDKLIIEGGSPLFGEALVSGAKNAALPLMAASILSDEPLKLDNIPKLGDLITMGRLLDYMGGKVTLYPQIDGQLHEQAHLDMSSLKLPEAPHELVKTMRASALVLGPLLARHGRARVSLPGGCAIGVRPIDLHLKALSQMGATFDLSQGDVIARAPVGGLKGAKINFETVTVTGTENVMMAAVLAKGRTIISNAAREPEVTDTAKALISMGAKIKGLETDELIIEGTEYLSGANHTVMPDRVEAATLIIACALAGGRCSIVGAPVGALAAVIDKLIDSGVNISILGQTITIESSQEPLKAVNVTTSPYPGFPTDAQAQFMALMTVARGASIITETIFENRFMHVSELRRLGADIALEGRSAVVNGVLKLSAAPLTASDLRASASLILAALVARGQSVVHRVYHLDRGYDRLDEKLRRLGAKIERVKDR
ncbi:MAG: UDP-N-acetylglucosamine 1-carboxyvinyltransferase [Deltaproteobacteria bacterium]|jgi:UDP-N-acetylglucosamine 1-carboxyvinyltransferase|nr:UDP-N-acetylglucosamine 1-carboxyvinyltransferase [Deltaproteobacteria bacterium]